MSRELPHANHFSDLIVWQNARELAKQVFEISKGFPKDEMYALTDQIRRSSRSVGAQIAEAWGKRRYERHFISKLTDADSEQYETQHWLITAFDAQYLTKEQTSTLGKSCKQIGSMIGGMIKQSDQFCGDIESSMVREPSNEYFNSENSPLF